MKHYPRLLRIVSFFICCLVATSFHYKPVPLTVSSWIKYTGSTPCGPFIKSALKIPGGTKCDFIKWNLFLPGQKISSDSFRLTALFGESQPNTNGFWGGGTRLEFKGKYSVAPALKKHHNKKLLQLYSNALQYPVLLLQLDDNLFYFLDNKNDLLVGNGGYSYILNKINAE